MQAYTNLAGFYLNKEDPKKAEESLPHGNPQQPRLVRWPYLRLAGLLLQEGARPTAKRWSSSSAKSSPAQPR